MYEFITIGGGQYFVDFFNGIASLMKSEDYLDTVKIVGTIAFMWMLLNSALQMSLEYSAKWFVTIFLVTQILITPKTTLHITDKTNLALQGATVDNVPFVIAYLASASSQIGYSLTSQFEAVYSLPDDLKYQNNGMIFGVNLMETVANATIYNSRFSETMDSFVRNCIAYDILLDSYSFDDLKSAPDIWEFITPFQSENRFFTYLSDGNSVEYPSCKEGINKLGASWSSELAEWQNPNSKKINFISPISIFGKSAIDVKRQVLTSLASNTDIVSDYLMGVSMTSSQMLKQAMTNNAIIAATENYEAEYNQQLYQNTRAMVQARSSYQTIGMQANHWLPILKIVIESVFYAAFPIVVLLTMIPNMTMAVLRGYCSTFFWLASWGPLYAILHRLMIDNASNKMTDGQALSLFNQQNIQGIVVDISAMAGYWAMFIPIISYGLARGGVAAMSSMSTAFMSVAQGAAMQAAQEGTTGNLSFGNVGLNSRHAYSGITMQNDSGMLTHYHQDGSNSITRGTAESDTGYNIHASDRLENMASQSMAQEQSLAHSKGVQSQQLEARGFESLLQNHRNIENSRQFSEIATSEERMAFNRIHNVANDFAKQHNISSEMSAKMFAQIGTGNIPVIGQFLKNIGVEAGGQISASTSNQDLYQEVQRLSSEHHLSQDFNIVKNAAQSNHLNFTDSQGQSINDTFHKSTQLSQEQSTHLENAQRYSQQQQLIRSNSAQIDHNYNQEFYNYVKDKYADGSPNQASDLFNPNNESRHQFLSQASSDFLESKFHKNEIGQDLSRDYAAESEKIYHNGPQNMMQNITPPNWNDEFKSIDNSGLENSTNKSYENTTETINNGRIGNHVMGGQIKKD